MSIHLKTAEVQARERRLNSSSSFSGTMKELYGLAQTCSIKNQKRCFSQNSSCMSGCAQGYLSAILDAAIINHAPIGCAGDAMGANNARKWGESAQGIAHTDVSIFSTNMNEHDTVFGSLEKLRETVYEAYRVKKPAAIFITTSCTSAIIGEDIGSMAGSLSKELGIPVVPVSCEGFRTKIWASGFDAAFHAILWGIVKPPSRKTNVVNVINFRASAKKEIGDLFKRFGFEPLFIAGYCTIDQLSRLSESAVTVSVCGTLGTYMGNGLEQLYGVPYVKSMQPHGIVGYESWLREFGKVVSKEDEVEEYIRTERAKIIPALEEIKLKFRGIRAAIGMGPSYAFNFTRILEELGIEVVHTAAWHLDQQYDHGCVPESIAYLAESSPDLDISVCDHQYDEIAEMLARLKPDLYLYRHPSNAAIAMKLGIASVSIIDEYMAFGYEGLLNFAQTLLDMLTNRNFERNLAARSRLPFSKGWLAGNEHRFLEEEV
jgi:nitrogenase molybdenum-iron protein alpha chain